eukprot:1284079-Rhodomonas_salina.1
MSQRENAEYGERTTARHHCVGLWWGDANQTHHQLAVTLAISTAHTARDPHLRRRRVELEGGLVDAG